MLPREVIAQIAEDLLYGVCTMADAVEAWHCMDTLLAMRPDCTGFLEERFVKQVTGHSGKMKTKHVRKEMRRAAARTMVYDMGAVIGFDRDFLLRTMRPLMEHGMIGILLRQRRTFVQILDMFYGACRHRLVKQAIALFEHLRTVKWDDIDENGPNYPFKTSYNDTMVREKEYSLVLEGFYCIAELCDGSDKHLSNQERCGYKIAKYMFDKSPDEAFTALGTIIASSNDRTEQMAKNGALAEACHDYMEEKTTTVKTMADATRRLFMRVSYDRLSGFLLSIDMRAHWFFMQFTDRSVYPHNIPNNTWFEHPMLQLTMPDKYPLAAFELHKGMSDSTVKQLCEAFKTTVSRDKQYISVTNTSTLITTRYDSIFHNVMVPSMPQFIQRVYKWCQLPENNAFNKHLKGFFEYNPVYALAEWEWRGLKFGDKRLDAILAPRKVHTPYYDPK